MPFLALTKGARARGIQTYARAVRLPEPIRFVELEYLTMRDWYVNQVGRLEQFKEAKDQAARARDKVFEQECNNKIHGIESSITEYRDKVKEAGRLAYSEAFRMVAYKLLPAEVKRVLEEETERLIGRPADELARKD